VRDLVRIEPAFSQFAEFPTRLDFLLDHSGGGLTWLGTYGPSSRWKDGVGVGMDILRKNDKVCVAFDSEKELVEDDRACGFTMHYRSVIGFGRASLIEDPAAKTKALHVIMRHYSDKRFTYGDGAVEKTLIIKVKLDHVTGKESI